MSCREVINIWSKDSDPRGRFLSNFEKAPFTLHIDNVRMTFMSVEGFWQALKYPVGDPRRIEAARSWGYTARQFTRSHPYWYWGTQKIVRGSPSQDRLLYAALKARFSQHLKSKEVLLSTGDAIFTHKVRLKNGALMQQSKYFNEEIYCKMFEKIREELRNPL